MAKKSNSRALLIIFVILILFGTVGFFLIYNMIYKNNVDLKGKSYTYIHIRTGGNFNELLDTLYGRKLIINKLAFEEVAKKKNLPSRIHPGKYRISAGMSNNTLVNELRSGSQEPVNITFNNIRKKEELAGKLAKMLEPDSLQLIAAINDEDLDQKYGFSRENILSMFVPNTYEMFWNITPKEFMARMAKEYKSFWNDDRKQLAKDLDMTQTQVMILASIVEKETTVDSDRPLVASVYINRLKKGMPLEADPTLIWALNDFTIRRVLNIHKQVESPYNTYKYKGLPPGPICIPSVASIDAVLENKKTDYLYFCAREDLSGYSNFSKSLTEHLNNARKYQQALNKRNIWK